MNDYAKAHFSTEQSPSREDARIQAQDVNEERPDGLEASPREGPQAPDAEPLLKGGAAFPKEARLRTPGEFRRVYTSGARYEGHFMTAFVERNGLDRHRLGVTVSRKTSTRAVQRNRAKRLLREAFRLSGAELGTLGATYDVVLNGKRSLLDTRLAEPLTEFREIVARVGRAERADSVAPELGSE
jgi:ribonuclease P protein component